MALLPSQIQDLVEITINDFTKIKFEDFSLPLQKYFAMNNLLLNGRVGEDGGMQLQWQVRFANAGNARVTALYEKDATNIDQLIKTAQVPWKFVETSWGYDVREELFNRGAEAILNLVQTRQFGAMNDLAALMEDLFWGVPANNTDPSEQKKPYGLLYWLQPSSSAAGFNGQNPSGFSDVAGIDSSSSTYATWRNYTDTYSAVTKADLIARMRKAVYKTNFTAPVPYGNITGSGMEYAICTTYDTVAQMESLLEGQNDNLGNDVASKDGSVVFRGHKVIPIPYLDTYATSSSAWKQNPVIGIHLGSFKCLFKNGEFMRKSQVTPGDSHNTRFVFYDMSCQFVCYNRRKNFYLYQV